ncbi:MULTISPECIES: glutaminyl-peptide cyclotransferase [Nocardia]|uniref:glutaminyl-peptide cyclotransferase n=1 Tax=Nocardia TaxID=1817 RepID=UPI000BF1304E|nr:MULTISPECIES: glutaminyl-peptide cyclotransferase [Nocardia]MBF6187096.1 glutaminyl-peptide cyclotransferase [Nocardia farcinica]MBF6246627.1 glutaminyl-peptide cyclotransferase [Nocardia elegans]MBF6312744.1 glutaminyl-peptide cyclotransferase [Nocardia farcinica]MBF6408401.1 glutaminyl-peptide cyclotransferase [Nocardia farcinica]PEH78870.1 glutaminyl-peptide cyclotransferase [Nocardia sp. FDAARGOS_372]
MERNRRSSAVAVLVGALVAAGCGRPADPAPRLRIEVVATRPHDRTAFTQGLEVAGGVLYEGTGLTGRSFVRATDLATGAELARADVPGEYFGEGITKAGATLWQLTWRDGVAFARDPATLRVLREVRYEGEGWGLCTRGERLVMSDGSDTLTFRDPETFAVTGTRTLRDRRGARLNELDCAPDGSVYANDYPSNRILRIDPDTGEVTGVADTGGLLTRAERADADVPNGIAALPGTDRFLLTGKYWPTMFEVRFVPE